MLLLYLLTIDIIYITGKFTSPPSKDKNYS